MEHPKYISAQSDNIYMLWQLEVQLYNFRELGISKNYIVLMGYKTAPSRKLVELTTKYSEVNWQLINDDRQDNSYLPSIKPYLIYRYLEKSGSIDFFLLDNDVIFLEKLDFSELFVDDVHYLSDTSSYTGYKYILSKDISILDTLCRIVKIDRELVISSISGGAQYILKGTTSNFWYKVYRDSNKIYRFLRDAEKLYSIDNPIQSWCAEMWAIMFNLLLTQNKCSTHKMLEFCWPTDRLHRLKPILHNAGVTIKNKDKLFYKGSYLKSYPRGLNFEDYSKEHCTIKYVEYIKKLM
jgi:hypothetical protein